ncbi:probable serine/threonine-protein kinase kinX isoform X2 [Prorops nasuta]|uniref:probable serine/threonine-protein kinase kinX isoform X2 n=1 Tax=Prorops nasuta TaxID=863751 RepID=UPI0034CDD7E3
MTVNIKFTKFDNTSWGFRLTGGSDFPQPLTVIRVLEGSLAECMGLKVGDIVVRLNDQPISNLTHGQAHEALTLAGNNFVLGIKREEDPQKVVEAIAEENIVPYKIPLDQLRPVFPEKILQETSVVEKLEETEEIAEPVAQSTEEEKEAEEQLSEKPTDDNSEIVPNRNLTDDEIAQLILEEEELLSDKGVLGVNFNKLKPRAPLLKQSKVIAELQHIATAPPDQVEELRRTSVFLQKPQRPVPKPKKQDEAKVAVAQPPETYKVVIKKQPKKSITVRLLEQGLLRPTEARTPEYRSEATTPAATPELLISEPGGESCSRPESKSESRPESKIEGASVHSADLDENVEKNSEVEALGEETEGKRSPEEKCTSLEKTMANIAATVDTEKIKELVSTEISLEKQLENVQRQLLALKQLPSEIENHLKIVSEQLHKIMELSGVSNGGPSSNGAKRPETPDIVSSPQPCEDVCYEECEDRSEEADHREATPRPSTAMSEEPPRIVEPSDDEEDPETHELEISVKSNDDDGNRVKKFIVSYESKVLKSRTPSPAFSQSSFEPDPNLSPKDQVIQELKHKRGRKHSQDLWPQAKQVELTKGRRWRCPNDFFNDETIAEVLCSQAEVIRGKAMGINFKKYEKKNLPNYDHLMGSSVYKMIHKMEREPKKGIPARPPKVNAAEDIIERVKSPAFSIADDRSTRSISH